MRSSEKIAELVSALQTPRPELGEAGLMIATGTQMLAGKLTRMLDDADDARLDAILEQLAMWVCKLRSDSADELLVVADLVDDDEGGPAALRLLEDARQHMRAFAPPF